MKRVLIFGINGFVGPYLTNELKSHNYEVFGADIGDSKSASNRYFKCNILDKTTTQNIFKKINPGYISSVGQSREISEVIIQINVKKTLNIFNACLTLGIKPKILLIGLSKEYISCNHPMDENTPINANNPYGFSKVAQEQFATIYRKKYNWPIYCARLFNHIGVGQKNFFVISNWCKQASEIDKSRKPGIIKAGNLDVSRNFTDVEDIVRAYSLIIESNFFNEIFIIGLGKTYCLSTILKMIFPLSSTKINYFVGGSLPRENDNKIIYCNNEKIKNSFNWQPSLALPKAIEWIYSSFMAK